MSLRDSWTWHKYGCFWFFTCVYDGIRYGYRHAREQYRLGSTAINGLEAITRKMMIAANMLRGNKTNTETEARLHDGR